MNSTLVISSRVDARDVASLAKMWVKQTGFQPKSTSSLVSDALATIVQSLERANPDIHVETIEEAYEVIRQLGLNAQSARSQRRVSSGLQQEIVQGLVPRTPETTFGQPLGTQYKPKAGDLDRDLYVAQATMEDNIKNGVFTKEEAEAKLIVELAAIRKKHKEALQKKTEEVKANYELSKQQPICNTQAEYEEPQIARADMTAEQRAAFDREELRRLKSGMSGIGVRPSQNQGEAVVAHNKEDALIVIQKQADKMLNSKIMSKEEVEAWLAKENDKREQRYNEIAANQPTSN